MLSFSLPVTLSEDSVLAAPTQHERLFLVTCWLEGSRPLFNDFLLGRLLVDVLRHQQHRADTWAYVIMPDYLHWLVELRPGMSLHKLIEQVLCQSDIVMRTYLAGEYGAIWRPQYNQQKIVFEHEARRLARQCIAEPRRQGLVYSVADYPLWDARRWLHLNADHH